eukprot:jgi/Botrbrau1/9308/Bobra.0111s0032.1
MLIMGMAHLIVGIFSCYIACTILPVVWFWFRARLLLRHLPREPEDTTTLLGCSTKTLGDHRHLAMKDMAKGGVVYTRLAWIQMIMVTDPEMVIEILEHPKFSKPFRFMYETFSELIGSSRKAPDLVTADGGPHDSLYRLLRKGIAPAFGTHIVRDTAFPVVQSNLRAVGEVLPQKRL